MYRINLYGAPGSGKTTLASQIFSLLKTLNYDCELIGELAREWAYTDRMILSFDQVYLFASQMHREDTLFSRSKANIIITDSPVVMNAFYGYIKNKKLYFGLESLARQFDNKYNSVNIFLKQNKDYNYSQSGRFHTLEESKKLESEMQEFLIDYYNKHLLKLHILEENSSRLDQIKRILVETDENLFNKLN